MKPYSKKPRSAALPTMSDVARLAGVSPMTVSRALNNRDSVTDQTWRKVQHAVEVLNYSPNQAARRLAGSRGVRLCFSYSNPSASFLSEFLVGLLGNAGVSGYELVIDNWSAGQDPDAYVAKLKVNGIDGIILGPPLSDAAALVDAIAASELPAVAVGSGLAQGRLSVVRIDDRQAAYAMTSQLIALGHEKIGFIIGHPEQSASERRLTGFLDALAAHSITRDDQLIVQGAFTYRSGLDAAEQLLAQPDRPTAIFASNDDMAAAVVALAHSVGYEVPSDLTVVGFDDTPLATSIWPELSTVRQPVAQMAERASSLLMRHIRSQRAGDTVLVADVVMEHALVRRQSDAAPRLRPSQRFGNRPRLAG